MKKNSGFDSLMDALGISPEDFQQGGKAKGGNVYDVEPEAASGSRGPGAGGHSFGDAAASFGDKMASWGKRALIILAIVLLAIVAFAYWWFHPPINIHSVDTWYFVVIFILLPIFLVLFTRHKAYQGGTAKIEPSPKKAKRFKVLSYLPIAVVMVGVLGAILSMSFFPGNAQKYAHVLETDSLEFTEDIKEVNYAEIPVIDRDSAALLGNRTLGEIPDFVSQFEISSIYSQINYQESPIRVSPLLYADIFKWFNNRSAGIPAYVVVNMTTQDTEIVRLSDVGIDDGIHYSESEPFVRNIDRHVQLSYPFYMFDEKSFEIDDEGRPWWICPVKEFTIGLFGGQTISRVVMCDAVTGETIDMPVEECPQWVDRVYPAELLIKQYNWSGAYMNGWINSWLGQQGVFQTTPGGNGKLGYNYLAKDDDVWVYTGVTSATADSSIIGFVLVNQRTAESHFYSVAGATETSAMSSAEGQVQHLGYNSTFPLLINVGGQPTYFMALKDNAGLVKMFAMIDIQRYQNVAVGDTVAECQEVYTQLLATNGVVLESDGVEPLENSAEGIIATITQVVVEGNSQIYVKLEGDNTVYNFSLPGLMDIVGYGVGDPIAFTYLESELINVVLEITSETPVTGDAEVVLS